MHNIYILKQAMIDWYPFLKQLHVLTAIVTASLMVLRTGLDMAGVHWRQTALRWLPHVNDSLLLGSAIGLLLVTGWMPFEHHWLSAKVLLLCGYIIAGKLSLDQSRAPGFRGAAAVFALGQLAAIGWLAVNKPWL